MIDEKALIETQAPSMAKILTATAIAAAVAVVILVVAVLPAEYGIDPIGTGKALGLMDLANATEKPAPAAHPVAPPAAAAEPVADSENAVTIVPILKPAGKAGDAPTVTESEIAELRPEIPDWDLVERDGTKQLRRVFTFDDFAQALEFTNAVGRIAEEEGHHPALLTEWGRVTVRWWTHKIRGLHRNDFVMAAKTDRLSRA